MLDWEARLGYTHKVLEHYRDGGVWPHYFHSEGDAKRAIVRMQFYAKYRTYELIEL